MKKNFIYLFAVATALLLVGCNKFEKDQAENNGNLIKITASIEQQDTKTYLNKEGDVFKVKWSADDAIAVVSDLDLTKTVYTSDNSGTGTTSTVFIGAPKDGNHYAVTYPAAYSSVGYANDIRVLIPSSQTYVAGNIQNGSLPMYGYVTSLDNVSFQHMGSIIKVKLYSTTPVTVASIKLKVFSHNAPITQNNISVLTGAVSPAGGVGDIDTITLNCGEGVVLSGDSENPTEFQFIMMGGVTCGGGFTVTVTTSESKKMTLTKSGPYTTVKGMIHTFPATAFAVDPADDNKKVQLDGGAWETLGECSGTPTASVAVKTADGHPLTSSDIDDLYVILNRASSPVITLNMGASQYSSATFVPFVNDKVSVITALPNNVTTLPNYAFDCYYLTSVNLEGITTFGQYTFDKCESMTTVVIPSTLTAMGSWMAWNNSYVQEFVVAPGNTILYSEDGVLFNAAKTYLREYPHAKPDASYTIPDGVTSVGGLTFSGNKKLAELHVPASVTSLNFYGSRSCPKLKTIYFDSATPCSISGTGDLPNGGALIVPGGDAYKTYFAEWAWIEAKGWTVNGHATAD